MYDKYERLATLEKDALIMSKARGLIKKKKITSNGRLYMELFGTGLGTARECCGMLGFNPDSNVTIYSDALLHIRRHQQQP